MKNSRERETVQFTEIIGKINNFEKIVENPVEIQKKNMKKKMLNSRKLQSELFDPESQLDS